MKVEFYGMPKELQLKDFLRTKWSFADMGWLVINLMPLVFYMVGTLSAIQAFLVYMAETLVIGLYNVVRLSVTTFIKGKDDWSNGGASVMVSGWMFVFFFIVHFGLFMFVQFSIFMAASRLGDGFSFLSNFRTAWKILGSSGQLFVLINAGILFINGGVTYIREKEYATKSMSIMMFEPYLRIFVQQFTVIAGGMMVGFGMSAAFLVIFMVVKIFFSCFIDERLILTSVQKPKN